MHRRGGKLWKSRAGMRVKSGFRIRCRLNVSHPRLRVFCLLDKMKQPFHRLWVSLALAGKSTFKSLLVATANTPASVYVPAAFSSNSSPASVYASAAASTHSFYTEAVADCIDFIKHSSLRDSTSFDVR
ncbi:hypothetical protein SUGI_0419060 [Cryptomeria japonica]|nr:hypothetical protein SUGI_0419060 [Cryptomeria japonica]